MNRFILAVATFLLTVFEGFAQFSGSGSGTETDPYRIFNATQLNQIRNFLNNTDVYFSLEADIDLSEWTAENNPNQGWQPIGTESSPFKGICKGNNHKISNLMIHRSSTDNVGLFGCIQTAHISDIKITNADIEGQNNVGTVVGHVLLSIDESAAVLNCSTSSAELKGKDCIGGIIGYVTTEEKFGYTYCNAILSVSRNYFDGNIVGSNKLGGIVGAIESQNGRSMHSFQTKNQSRVNITGRANIGGIVGYISMYAFYSDYGGSYNLNCFDITGCYSNLHAEGTDNIGGIVGYSSVASNSYKTDDGVIENCYSTGYIAGASNIGGICGYSITDIDAYYSHCRVQQQMQS